MTVHPYDYQPIPSDHCIISFSVTCTSVTKHIPKNTSQFVYDYSKADYNGLNNFLSSIDFSVCEQFTDIESIWSFIKDSILDGINTNIPKVRIKPNSSPKWFTSNIRHQIKCLRTLRRKHKHHPTDHTFNQIIETHNHSLFSMIKMEFSDNPTYTDLKGHGKYFGKFGHICQLIPAPSIMHAPNPPFSRSRVGFNNFRTDARMRSLLSIK